MSLIAITGATGFVGAELSAVFRANGHTVIELGRRPDGRQFRYWKLGEQLPQECAAADVIVHLASATLIETKSTAEAARRDRDGTRILIEQIRQLRQDGRPRRLIFLSSQSARANAANAYGRSKWEIERMLDQQDEIIIRPGLVYGEPPASVFATFDRLSRLPIVPIVENRKCIQPIHVRELASCIVQIATMEDPPRCTKLGAVDPLTLRHALEATARRAGRRVPIMIPVPANAVRLGTRVLDRLVRVTLTERLDGVTGLEPMETKTSLAALGQTLEPYDSALGPT